MSISLQTKAIRVSIESPGLENILQVPGNGAEVEENYDARNGLSAILSVLNLSRAIFRPTSSTSSVRSFCLCTYHWKLSSSGVRIESSGSENIPRVPANRAKDAQNHDARKAVSATLSVLKWTGAIFQPRSSKISLQKVFLCSFHCKPRPSGVSLDSSKLENIAQIRGNRAEFCQNYDARKALSATLSFLKWTGALFRPRS